MLPFSRCVRGAGYALLTVLNACGNATSAAPAASDDDDTWSTAVCGSSVLEGDETCDDGNVLDGDGCSSECRLEDGFICTETKCEPDCGDGLVVAGEACDPGAVGSGYCKADCSGFEGACGDGKVQPAAETCDDALTTGCQQCQPLTGWVCSGTECVTVCGDGYLAGGEVCDDGNEDDGDYCSRSCTAITGACGDGVIIGGFEACDDGNAAAVDGCSPTCTLELGATCSGTPSKCVFSGFPSDAPVGSLSDSDQLAFCEWLSIQVGGYPKDHDCGSVKYFSYSPQECVWRYASECADTVSEIERCFASHESICTAAPACRNCVKVCAEDWSAPGCKKCGDDEQGALAADFCDGKKDCRNGWDERCCSSKVNCNGVIDCEGGTDESLDICS